MKIWYGHGSEHSMNLVMIGRFKDVGDAHKAKEIIEWLTKQVEDDVQAGKMKIGERVNRYSDGMQNIMQKTDMYTIGPTELEQFAYDVKVKIEVDQIVVTTDEIDVSAFLKVLLEKGARVEVYSAHDYSDTAYGRGK